MPLDLTNMPKASPCPFCGSTEIEPDFAADELDASNDTVTDAWLYCRDCQCNGPVAAYDSAPNAPKREVVREAYELWNKRVGCAMGLACPEHNDAVHGAEAEELRKAFEKMADELANESGEMPEALRDRIIGALDEVEARDSLAYLEARNRAGADR